jgi:hypothetical protein
MKKIICCVITVLTLAGCENPAGGGGGRQAPGAPANIKLIETERQLTVTWEAAAGAESYEVFYGTDEETNNGAERPAETRPNVTYYGTSAALITSLSNGTTYYVWVKALNSNGETFSEAASGTPRKAISPPETPKNINVARLDGQLLVNWDIADGAAGYEVYLENNGGWEKKLETAGHGGIISELTNGTEYTLRVRAVNSAGPSGYSASAMGAPAAAPVFTTLEGLAAYFAGKPKNTAAAPYAVALSGFDLSAGELGTTVNALIKVYRAAGGRYFSLDLSGCTGNLTDGVDDANSNVYSLLVNLVLGDSITSIGAYTFNKCRSLKSISLPEGIESIGNYAFQNCSSLQSINLSKKLKSIGTYAFYGCNSLESVILSEGLTSIGNYAFRNCSSLQSVTLPKSLQNIGIYTFANCNSLQYVNLPDGLTSIGTYTFRSCSSLQSITLPEGLASIGAYTFTDCTSLQSITLPKSLESIGNYAFNGCASLQSVTLPEGLETLGNYVFQNCSSLQSINIPAGVSAIPNYAFSGCRSLQPITLPDSITSIGAYAFNNCASLDSVTIRAVTPPAVNANSFGNTSASLKFYVPAGSVETYKNSSDSGKTAWKDVYASRIYAIPDGQ